MTFIRFERTDLNVDDLLRGDVRLAHRPRFTRASSACSNNPTRPSP